MNDTAFDTLTRRASAIGNRRSSLKAIGAAGVLAAFPLATDAGKAGKKARKKCKRQVGPCRKAFDAFCEGQMGAEECFDAAAECCGFLKKCKSGQATQCIIDAFLVP